MGVFSSKQYGVHLMHIDIVLNKSNYFATMKFHQWSGSNFEEFVVSELCFLNAFYLAIKSFRKNDQL